MHALRVSGVAYVRAFVRWSIILSPLTLTYRRSINIFYFNEFYFFSFFFLLFSFLYFFFFTLLFFPPYSVPRRFRSYYRWEQYYKNRNYYMALYSTALFNNILSTDCNWVSREKTSCVIIFAKETHRRILFREYFVVPFEKKKRSRWTEILFGIVWRIIITSITFLDKNWYLFFIEKNKKRKKIYLTITVRSLFVNTYQCTEEFIDLTNACSTSDPCEIEIEKKMAVRRAY